MTRITGEIATGAQADVVSGFVAGQRNEPARNPHMARSAKVTPGRPGRASSSARRSGPGVGSPRWPSGTPASSGHPGWPRPRGWLRPGSAGRSRSSRLALARGCGGHGTPGSPGRCGCWHRSWPGWADGRNERRGQGSSGTWSPPSTRRAPAPGSSPAPRRCPLRLVRVQGIASRPVAMLPASAALAVAAPVRRARLRAAGTGRRSAAPRSHT